MKKYVFLLCLLHLQPLSAQPVIGKLVDLAGNSVSDLLLQLYIKSNAYSAVSGVDGSFTFNSITAVKNEQLPTGYSVTDNYPNPFNPTTRFEISVPGSAVVCADIFNVLGEKVHALSDRVLHAGVNNLDNELNGLPNGFYIAQITVDGRYSVVKKMLLLYGCRHLHAAGNFAPQPSASMSGPAATPDINIDSLVVITSIGKTIFKNLPNLTGSLLNLGNLTINPGVIGMTMVAVTGGTFVMGQSDPNIGGTGYSSGEQPVHSVSLGAYSIDKYEVTFEKWTDVRNWALTHGYFKSEIAAGTNGYTIAGTNNPVSSVNWYDVVKWCNARSEKEGFTPAYYTDNAQTLVYRSGEIDLTSATVKWSANGYRLPTEAEWELFRKLYTYGWNEDGE